MRHLIDLNTAIK